MKTKLQNYWELKRVMATIFLLSILFSCKDKPTPTYSNVSKSAALDLLTDSTFSFSYQGLFDKEPEKGTYRLFNDSIVLYRKSYDKIDSVDLRYTCWDDNPDTLLLTFENLYRNKLQVKVRLNNSEPEFETDSLGNIIFLYSELVKMRIIDSGAKIQKFSILYNNKQYVEDMNSFQNSRIPNRIDFTLNQFVGEPFATLKRIFLIKNDTIELNGSMLKFLGNDYKLFKTNQNTK